MIYRGRVWLSIGRWARLHGIAPDTAKRYLQVKGAYLGSTVHRCPVSGDTILRVEGYDVLLRQINGQHWAYLPKDDDPEPDMTEDDKALNDANIPLAKMLINRLFL